MLTIHLEFNQKWNQFFTRSITTKPLLCTTAVPEEEEVGIEEMGIEEEITDQEKEGETIRKVLGIPRMQKET